MFSSIRCSIFRIYSFIVRCHIKKFWFCYRVNKKSEHVIAPGLAKFYAESYKRALCIFWVLNIKRFSVMPFLLVCTTTPEYILRHTRLIIFFCYLMFVPDVCYPHLFVFHCGNVCMYVRMCE